MKELRPPRLAEKLFDWYCGLAKTEDLRGDLEEWFYLNAKNKTPFRAKLIYWKQILSLMASYAIRKRKRDSQYAYSTSAFSTMMLRNYAKVAVRNLYKHKYFTIVNATGLAIGMSLSLLFITMFAYVCTFDNFHVNESRIFRVISSYQKGIDSYDMASAPVVLGEKLKTGVTGVEKVTRIMSNFNGDVVMGNINVPIRGYYVDPEFLSIFTFELVEGNINEALRKPNSIVITQTAATRLFGRGSASGKTIEIVNKGSFEITGILKDPPKNTHMDFESLVSFSSFASNTGDVITYPSPFSYGLEFVYVLVEDAAELGALSNYLATLSQQVSKSADAKVSYGLQALSEITPGKELAMVTGGLGPQWDYTGFYIFAILCLLILIPACFNYANISIARAIKRAKEIGLRKTMGGQQQQIFFQFIAETIVVTTLSLVGALLLFFLVRGEFKAMMVGASSLDLSLTWTIAIFFLVFAIATGFAAGMAPALYFSRLNPIQALKNQSSTKIFSGMWMRKSLTVFQFALSFGFIVALVVFSRQYRYAMNYDFGFQRENILDVELGKVKPDLFASELSKLSTVHSISFSSDVLGLHSSDGDSWMQFEDRQDSIKVAEMFVDPNYIQNLDLTFLAGSNFPNRVWNQEQHIIINEQFLQSLAIATPADAIGKIIRVDKQDLEIIGVLKDFHFSTLNEPIKKFAFRTDPSRYSIANLKVSFTDAYAGISEMEKVWKRLGTDETFQANFFNDQLNRAYEFYTTVLKIIGFLGMLAISISLLGMLGMVVYTSESRMKEVGIRKVMGASVQNITLLLSRDYLKLMGIACLLALPLTIWVVDKMLSMQHYHVTLGFGDVIVSLVLLFGLGLATIGSQTYKTAMTNPAETLRSE